jgi:hypothetical protein
MAFELAPALLSDIPEIVEVAIAAFESDPILGLMRQSCSVSDITDYNIQVYRGAFETPGVKFFKIVDTKNRLV